MKKHAATLILAALVGLAIGTQGALDVSHAQEKTDAAKPVEKKSSFRRLPNYFGQVGLSGAQKDEIYKIQETAGEQIESLRAQIETLEKKRDDDVRAVLTDEQRKKVDELVAAAKKRAEDRRKKATN
jgi:Spy/CpxP family protein refolding chaperone